MAKKKKPQLKASVPRGFATTSVPKREAPQASDLQEKEKEKETEQAQERVPEPRAPPHETADAFDPKAAEEQALQELVEAVQPKVEKESLRKLKTMEFNQRLARSLPMYVFSRRLREQVLALARGECCECLEPKNDSAQPELPAGPAPPTAPQHAQDDQAAPNPLLPTPMVQEALGTPPLPDTHAKTLELALGTWNLLKSLGFTQERADQAIEYAPNLDVEEAVAYLLLHMPDSETHSLSMRKLEPKDPPKKVALDSEFASAIDETLPPRHSAYVFERHSNGRMRPQQPSKPEPTATVLDAVPPGLPQRVWEETQRALAAIRAMLESDSPWTDVIEHPVDAYCTARMALLRVDQERKRRQKVLGKVLDPVLADAAYEDRAQHQCAQLITRANDMMQQAEMQPAFHKKVAAERFKERMRQDAAAAKAPAAQGDDHARRRAEIERAIHGDAAPETPGAPADTADTAGAEGREARAQEAHHPVDAEPAVEAESAPMPGTDVDNSAPEGDSLFGTLLDEPEAPAETTRVQLRTIPPSQGSRTPRALLADLLKQVDQHATARYTPLGGSVCRAQLEIRWNASVRESSGNILLDTYRLSGEGCASQPLADDLIATVALNCLGRDRQAHRTLPAGYRAFWEELEAARRVEKHAFLRSDYAHVQDLLQRRAAHPVPVRRMRRVQKHDAAPRPQRVERVPAASPELAEQFAARQASEAYQAMLPGREQLPIAASRARILESVVHSQVVVLSGETGCGKSTQLPAFLLEDALARGQRCKIYVTEPRRISAISLAERVSQELGEARGAIGGPESYVGYAIRLDSQIGRNARLIYATTGIALRMLESNAFDEVTHIIIDEVHERSIESDFLLMVLRVLMRARPDLKVVLMSATLDASRISEYFGGCPMLHVPGRTFPVDVHYLEDVLELTDYTLEPNSPYVLRNGKTANRARASGNEEEEDEEDEERASGLVSGAQAYSPKTAETLAQMNEYAINYDLIAALLHKLFTDARFDSVSPAVLVFLPGIGEIRQCEAALSGDPVFAPQHCRIHVLHSSIAPEEQAEAFVPPPPGMRKVVLATNIAETGITIPDITCVVDTGRHREMRYDEKRKISRLVECFIARSNAKQRRGRAGRVRHGVCFHLFTKMRHDQIMDAHPIPEMLRLSLQELALTLKAMQIRVGSSIEDALSQALDAPQAINVQRAVASLVEVQALTPNEEITPLGRHLCHMPLDVHLGKFLLIATRFRCLDPALTVAAVLNSKSPFLTLTHGQFRDTSRNRFNEHHSDFMSFVNMYRSWRRAIGRQQGARFCATNFLAQEVLFQIEELRQQYLSYLADAGFVNLSKEVRRDLARNRSRQGRPRLVEVPAELDLYAECPQALTLALVAALYPKLLWIEPRSDQMRTLTNNQVAAIHPSSVNFRTFPGSMQTHFLLYHAILMSKRLYAWDTAYVDDLNVLLAGGEPEFKYASRSLFLDHNRVRMSICDPKSLVALRVLRSELMRSLQASYHRPGLAWEEEDFKVFALTLQALGASHHTATTGKPDTPSRF